MLAFRMAFIFWISNIPAINKDFLLFKNVSQFSLGKTARLLLLNEIPPQGFLELRWAFSERSTPQTCANLLSAHSLLFPLPGEVIITWISQNQQCGNHMTVACDHDLIILSLLLLPMEVTESIMEWWPTLVLWEKEDLCMYLTYSTYVVNTVP